MSGLSETDPEPGDVIASKYVLLERVGAGGMGVVFRAAQPARARTVAIKLLHRALVGHRPSERRFQDEAIAASRLVHRNVVAVLDCGETADGTPVIVLDYGRGPTLSELAKRDLLPLVRIQEIVRQLLTALDEAHAEGVVHADVKTENVLVESTPDGDRVRLVDFGLAHVDDVPRVDEDGEAVISGTPDYMAPEVIAGRAATPAADLYAVGVILYELLTGATPFGGGPAAEIMRRHLEDVAVPPSLRRPDRSISRALDHVVLRALAKDPARRFASAAEFAEAMRRGIRSCRVTNTGMPRGERAGSSERATKEWRGRLARGTHRGD